MTKIYVIGNGKIVLSEDESINIHRNPEVFILSFEELTNSEIEGISGAKIKTVEETCTYKVENHKIDQTPEYYNYYINEQET